MGEQGELPCPCPGVSTRGVGTRAETSSHRRDGLRAVLAGSALGVVLGPVVGVLWLWIAPTPTAVNTDGAIYLKDQDTKEFIAADGWFLVIGLIVGAICGGLIFWKYRTTALPAVLGLTAGALAGAFIAWKVGEALGPASLESTVVGVPDGGTLAMPISIRAKGVLFGWPLGGVVAFLSLTLGLEKAVAVNTNTVRAEQEHFAALEASYAADEADPRWA